ncbi:MAG: CinA family nicotinamide mononucleotide deamidase-related protein [Candidatus Riflebacteria bacterium]|nr:CinA family nicotinamide mononucleotide deamidase-related protein [Candidatus Riflebacteria bacterium]
MKKNTCAEIFSIGTELLLGEITDTNSTYLSQRLRDLGIFVYRKNTVGDNVNRLTQALKEALTRADIIILSGGLGPTDDDVTREAICEVFGETPKVDPELFKELEEKFTLRNRTMPISNTKQAWLIPSAKALKNPIGTAPGWFAQKGGKTIIALPGPPSEMTKMWSEQAEKLLPITNTSLYHITIHTSGIGESDLCEKIQAFTRLECPGIGTYARKTGVDIRIAAAAQSTDEAKQIAKPVVDEISKILAPWIYGYDNETLPSAIMKLCSENNLTFAAVESVTGGFLTEQISACPGISCCFKGGITACSTDTHALIGIDPTILDKNGQFSKETAKEMAKSAQKIFKTDFAVATTGIDETAIVAVAGLNGTVTSAVNWLGDREMIRNRVSRTALQLLFETIRETTQSRLQSQSGNSRDSN